MAWFWIIGFLIFVWIISLCIFHLVSHMTRRNSFKKNDKALQQRNALLVIAHPDGDADSKGNIRKRELYQACATLKVPMQQVKVVDHPDLQDGFGKVWDHNLLANIINEVISNRSIDMIISFDKYGVSGHCNHRDVHYGVCKLLYDTPYRDIEAWELVSTNILRKYSGPIDMWLSMFVAMLHSNGTIQFVVNEHSNRSFLAMAQHASQWVWFRKCFVAMSSYTYMNTLRKIQ